MKPPHEFKIISLRECSVSSLILDTPQQATEYWNTNISSAPWFDPCKEALVVLVLLHVHSAAAFPDHPGEYRKSE